MQRICGSDRLCITHTLLDSLRSTGALPQPDEPEPCKTTVAQDIKFLIGDLVESLDPAAIFLRKLFEPNIGIFSDEYQSRHPVFIGAVALIFLIFASGISS